MTLRILFTFAMSAFVVTLGCGKKETARSVVEELSPSLEELSPSLEELVSPSPGPAVGQLAPEIEGPDIDGVTFKLSDYRGQIVFLDFWGNW